MSEATADRTTGSAPAQIDVETRSAMNSATSYPGHPASRAGSSGATAHLLGHADVQAAFRRTKLLLGGFLAVSVVTLVAAALLRHHPALVNNAVWVRGTIVAADGALMLAMAARAAGGSRGAFRRLRIISAITIVAVAVIVALPGTIPLWMKAEQVVCGLLMIGVAATVNTTPLRSLFARR